MEENAEAFAEAEDVEAQMKLHQEYLDLMDDMVNGQLLKKYGQ